MRKREILAQCGVSGIQRSDDSPGDQGFQFPAFGMRSHSAILYPRGYHNFAFAGFNDDGFTMTRTSKGLKQVFPQRRGRHSDLEKGYVRPVVYISFTCSSGETPAPVSFYPSCSVFGVITLQNRFFFEFRRLTCSTSQTHPPQGDPMKKFTSALFLLTMAIMSPQEVMGDATCYCKITYTNLTGLTSASGVCQDLTGTVNKSYSGLDQQSDANQTDCNTRCTGAASSYTGSQAIAACACAAGVVSGTAVRAWSAVGMKEYKTSQQIGVLKNTPKVTKTVWTCPAGWLANNTNVNGGVTWGATGCKKLACRPNTITPLPDNGTLIGTWGFTWGNECYAFGSTANGGAATSVTTVVSPAVCSF